MNYSWNEAWTSFTQKEYTKALPLMERTAKLVPENPEVLYDFSVIQLSAGEKEAALKTLEKAVSLNPKLKQQAAGDNDLKNLRNDPEFQKVVK
jgi:regulator of sirC expression with transglutaminase-like and TPR domain